MHRIPHRADAGARLVTGAHLRHVEAVRGEPRPDRVRVGHLPGEPTETVRRLRSGLGVRPGADLDRDPSQAEEEQPDASLLEGLVQREPDPEAFAEERASRVRRRAHHDEVIERMHER